MKVIKQDLLAVKEGILIHVCNCKGAFNAGVAFAIRNKYTSVYHDYRACKDVLKLGTIMPIFVNKNLFVIHMMAQENYGRDPNKIYLDIDAFTECIRQVKEWNHDPEEFYFNYENIYKTIVPNKELKTKELNVYAPYLIGCGYAKGNWDDVSFVLETELPDIILCKKD